MDSDLIGNYIVVPVVFGLTSIIILMLCAGRKKRDSVTMIRYVKNEELEVETGSRSRASTNNGIVAYEKENEKRSSQHSLPNENRILPDIPKTNGNGVHNGTSATPDPSGTPGNVSQDSTQRNSGASPKKSTVRRLPALPPAQVDIAQAAEIAKREKEVDATYEDVRDDRNAPSTAQTETIGSGDSALYAKVPEDLQKGTDEESDLYAQVGAANDDAAKPSTSAASEDTRKPSSSSEDDQNMDSPTAVTYASVDKMKKTMSVKRKVENSASSNSVGAAAPPVPDRNFDEDEEVEDPVEDPEDSFPPPPPDLPEPLAESEYPENSAEVAPSSNENESTGPAYDTISVRESFAHQRLRQMVEDEQRNRYVNTSTSSNGPDLYSQIDEENSEAVYESVSVPGSADGTVGVTGQPSQGAAAMNNAQRLNREDAYSTIGAVQASGASNSSAPPPPPPNMGAPQGASNSVASSAPQSISPNYENIEPR